MKKTYDAIVIGGGHNGLTAAATLSQAGRSVLVLEQRPVLGGASASEEIFPGYAFPTGADDAGLFLEPIIDHLSLEQYGLTFHESPALLFSPQSDGRSLTLWRDDERSLQELAAHNSHDGRRFPAFRRQIDQIGGVIREMSLRTPPDIFDRQLSDLTDWGRVGWSVRRFGQDDMMEFMRVLPLSVQSYLDEWFGSDTLKAAIGASGITGLALGPRAAGTNLMFMVQNMQGFMAYRPVVGGIGQLSAALARAAESHGATIKTDAPVASILMEDDLEPVAAGVRLISGEEIAAGVVLSSADPQRTLFGLAGPQTLEPDVMRQVRNIIYRGTTAKVLLGLNRLPEFIGQNDEAQLTGRIRLCPNLDYLEKASDAAKYGRYSERPYLEITIPTLLEPDLAPNGHHIMAITVRYAPYHLHEGTWPDVQEAFTETVLATLATYAPGIRDCIVHQYTLTPADLEDTYGLTEGSIHQGQMGLDQLLIMRPIPGWARYETPVSNLYLCGAGAHPGGGVTGAPGYNAAQTVLQSQRN